MNKCENCNYFKKYASETTGACRINPPVFDKGINGSYKNNVYPLVTINNWCGSWSPIDKFKCTD